MAYEERQVVTDQPVETVDTVPATEQRVVQQPATVVEQVPSRRTVVQDDPVGNAYAASQMIQTIVWAVVVLVLLVVALWALHVYAGWF
jgi:hypothetical protein